MKTRLIKYEQDEKGTWIASIEGVTTSAARGRTIDECRQRAIARLESKESDDSGASINVLENVKLPERAQIALARYRKTRQRADDEAARLKLCASETAAFLAFELGFGLRDVGELMGVSHQRVHQLLSPD